MKERPYESVLFSEKYAGLSKELKPGEVIEDEHHRQYHILKKLGQGGFGFVYEVEDQRTGMKKVLKILRNEAIKTVDDARDRFDREIRVMAQVHNPFLVAALDVIQFTHHRKPMVGLLLEDVEGVKSTKKDQLDAVDLHQHLAQYGMFSPGRTAVILAELAFGLASLHRVGLLHRDLKAENVFLGPHDPETGEEFVKIGDFGLVGFAFEDELKNETVRHMAQQSSEEQDIVGTEGHQAPEVLRGENWTRQSDLYSVGKIGFELLTGCDFHVHYYDENTKRVVSNEQLFLPREEKEIPAWMRDIISKLLKTEASDRFQSASELFQALKAQIAIHEPDLLTKVPFIWDINSEEYTPYDASIRRVA